MKDPRVYLAQILECIGRIEEFTATGRDTFLENRMMQDAVIRNFQVIGEARKRLAPEFREQHPSIPWKQMAAFRDVLTHDYMSVDLLQVWGVIDRELPMVKIAIANLLPPLDQLEAELAGDAAPSGAPEAG
ncbi:MAG: DUF86 domain-containing protein [Blastocatellia bacterium]